MATASQHQEAEATDAAALEVDVSWLFAEPPAEASPPATRGSRLQTSSVGRSQDPAVSSAAAASLVPQLLARAARLPRVGAPSRSVEAGPGSSIWPHGGPGPSIRGPFPSIRSHGPSTRPHRGRGRAATASSRTPHHHHRPNDDEIDMLPVIKLLEDSRLMRAAGKGAVEEVRAELAAGADVGERDCLTRQTVLHCAAANGHEEVVRCLLESGADVRATDNWSRTPLHDAAQGAGKRGRAAVVRLLLAASADPNARDGERKTPLHYAAWNSDVEVVRCLLDAGADSRAVDHMAHTPLDVSRGENLRELIEMLVFYRPSRGSDEEH